MMVRRKAHRALVQAARRNQLSSFVQIARLASLCFCWLSLSMMKVSVAHGSVALCHPLEDTKDIFRV